jgi:hypothetical protein
VGAPLKRSVSFLLTSMEQVSMAESTNKGSLVVDRNYGERLHALVGSGPVWLIDTEVNRKAATKYWQLNHKPKREAAVTTFKYLVDDSVAATCLKILRVIDLTMANILTVTLRSK